MAKIISIHSFRRGTGKTNILVSLAARMVARGLRVGVVDGDLQSPSLHVLYGIDTDKVRLFLNDYLMGRCSINEAVLTIAEAVPGGDFVDLFCIPAHPGAMEIMELFQSGGQNMPELLTEGCRRFAEDYLLDVLLIDTQAGMNEFNLAALASADTALIVFRLDQQNYQGTAVLAELARRVGSTDLKLIINEVHEDLMSDKIKSQAEETYGAPVAAIIPFSETMQSAASQHAFVVDYPDHPLSAILTALADGLLE
jgi:MinD-like ATPase involved in chromosome partitioning or flagellar assembly